MFRIPPKNLESLAFPDPPEALQSGKTKSPQFVNVIEVKMFDAFPCFWNKLPDFH